MRPGASSALLRGAADLVLSEHQQVLLQTELPHGLKPKFSFLSKAGDGECPIIIETSERRGRRGKPRDTEHEFKKGYFILFSLTFIT